MRGSESSSSGGEEEGRGGDGEEAANTIPALPKQSWLLRLFESTHFDSSMAINYLFNSKVRTEKNCGVEWSK